MRALQFLAPDRLIFAKGLRLFFSIWAIISASFSVGTIDTEGNCIYELVVWTVTKYPVQSIPGKL